MNLIKHMHNYRCEATTYMDSVLVEDRIDTHHFMTQYGVAQV